MLHSDQYFSVVSRRFKHLVFQSGHQMVVSFEDFQREVAAAFKVEAHKPLCVERVAANFDYTRWLLPYKDKHAGNLTQFKNLLFRKQTPEEIALYDSEGSDPSFHRLYDVVLLCVLSMC